MKNIETFDRSAWSALEIGLPVDEIEPMKRFYCEGLGFKSNGYVNLPAAHIEAFRYGNCLLKLTVSLRTPRPKPRQPDPSAIYMTLRVAALDESLACCLATGGTLLVAATPFQTMESRLGRFAFVSDPMGNRVELVEGNAWSE